MRITEIKERRRHLNEVFLDGGEQSVLLDKDVCIEEGLRGDLEMESESLKKLISRSDNKRALSRGVWYIERGGLTVKSMKTKLARAGFSENAVTFATDRLVELGLLNDREYAAFAAENLIASNYSKHQVYQKLYERGVPKDIIKEVLETVECDEQTQVAELIRKKYASKLGSEDGVKKVFAALLRRGFKYSSVKEALKNYSEELEYSEENEL